MYVLLQGGNGGRVIVALVDGIVGPTVALGIGVGAGLSLHFLRKRRFLSGRSCLMLIIKRLRIAVESRNTLVVSS